jgi:phthiodiolone/phenolphthiodiolone dimycocerosates ketoreductase
MPSKVDPWVVLAAIGTQTRHVYLSPSVTDYQRCHPAKTSQIVATLDEISNGRAILGIGAGEAMNTVPYGIKWEKPDIRLEKLKEAIQVTKLLWGSTWEKPVDFNGKHYQLTKARLDQHPVQRPHPPVYLGAYGNPRSLELAGELGEGWLPFFCPPEIFSKRLELVKRGAEKARRRAEDIDRVVWLYAAVSSDPESRRKAKALIKWLLLSERYVLKDLGYSIPLAYRFGYQVVPYADANMVKAYEEAANKVPDEAAEKLMEKRMLAVGDADECIETIEGFRRVGATHFAIRHLGGPSSIMEETLRQFSSKVMPYFEKDRSQAGA